MGAGGRTGRCRTVGGLGAILKVHFQTCHFNRRRIICIIDVGFAQRRGVKKQKKFFNFGRVKRRARIT